MPTDASRWLSSAQKTSSEALFAEAGSVGAERACSKAEAGIVLNVPTVLTLMRVAAVPALAWAFFQGGVAAAAAFWCFAGAAITDFMDGYLARSLGQATRFGAFLDPVADKLIVVTTMVLLAAAPPGPLEGVGVPAWALPAAALVIACRELLVSAVRELAAAEGAAARRAVDVNAWGKLKTFAQMFALLALLAARIPNMETAGLAPLLAASGGGMLALAVALTAYSGVIYFRKAIEVLFR